MILGSAISSLPMSSSFTKFLNGLDQEIILYVNRTDDVNLSQNSTIEITLYIDRTQSVILS
mgnify:CR=1 FL=1